MSRNCCAFLHGGTRFFTVNLLERKGADVLVHEIGLLHETVHQAVGGAVSGNGVTGNT